MVLQCCTTLPCPWLPTSDAEGPSYGRRSTSCWKVPVWKGASSCHRTAGSLASRRSSWQLTVRDADPTNVCLFTTWYYTRYWVWNFEKDFKHSTHRAQKLDSAITLGYVNCFGCECNISLCTLPLRHTIKMLLHQETVPNDNHGNSQSSPTPANTPPTDVKVTYISPHAKITRNTQFFNTDTLVESHQL